MRRHRQHPAVGPEIEAAARWYEERGTGLGEEFLDAVEGAIAVVCEAPAMWPLRPLVPADLGIHCFVMGRFPFAVSYLDEPAGVVILAVAHTRRQPLYWLERRTET